LLAEALDGGAIFRLPEMASIALAVERDVFDGNNRP
jgi:hypothetical protein